MGLPLSNPLAMAQAAQELLKKVLGVDLTTPEGIAVARKLPDEEKLRLMDSAFEMAGATGGAIAGGGVASIPGAGAGAVAGRSASRLLGKAMGLQEQKRTAGEEAGEFGKTFALNAAGEGVGRLIPAAAKAGKALAGNMVKGAVKATPEAELLAQLAAKHGVELNLSQRSGKPWLQSVELVLDRSPFSASRMKDFRQKQYGQFQSSINEYLNSLHSGEITMEDFARLADDSISSLQRKFNETVASKADAVAGKLAPKAVSDVETGVALKGGREQNINSVRMWANKAYGKIRSEHGAERIDLTPFKATADELLGEIPEGQLSNIFPSSTTKLLRTAALPSSETAGALDDIAKSQAGKTFANLSPEQQSAVRKMAEKIGIDVSPQGPNISLAEAMRVRGELLLRASTLSGQNSAQERRYLYSLADSLNDSVENSLGKTPGKEGVHADIKKLNSEYRGYMEKLYPPASTGKKGSVAAGELHANQIPEKLPKQLSGTETMVRQTEAAVSPSTVAATGEAPMNAIDPMQALRRNRFDATRGAATLRDAATGESRLSPSAMVDELPDSGTAAALYSEAAPDVAELASPELVGRERVLFSSPLAKSTKAPDAKRVFDSAFPKRGFGGNVQETLDVMNDAGRLPETQRGFAQGVLSQSETQMPSIADERALNPRTLERNLNAYGDTTKKVLGPEGEGSMGEIVDLGKGITAAEATRGNPSGTAQMSQNIGLGKRALDPREWPSLAKDAVFSAAAGKKFTDPKSHNWMFDPPEKLLGGADYPLSGAAGRAASTLPFEVGSPESDEEFQQRLLGESDSSSLSDQEFEQKLLRESEPPPAAPATSPGPPPINAAPEFAGKGKMPAPADPGPPPAPAFDATRPTRDAARIVAPGRIQPMDEQARRKFVQPKF